jgi:hypothetical protein
MIDRWIRPLIDPRLAQAGRLLAMGGIGADAVTIGACALGLAGAATRVVLGWTLLA